MPKEAVHIRSIESRSDTLTPHLQDLDVVDTDAVLRGAASCYGVELSHSNPRTCSLLRIPRHLASKTNEPGGFEEPETWGHNNAKCLARTMMQKPGLLPVFWALLAVIRAPGLVNRRKFRSQTSDYMDRWKAEKGRGREKRKIRRKKSRRERVSRKKMQMREKVGKSRNTVFSQWFGAPEGSKSRLAKAAGAEPAGQMRDEKLHAVVARSTFASQNVQNTWVSEHVWKLRCRKSARRCGAKHICKSKCTKHTILGPLLVVEMSKKCTSLWHEAHLQVQMYKAHHSRTTFGSWDVEKVHAVVARSTFRIQNVKSTRGSDLLEVEMSRKCTPLWREAHFEVKMLKTPGVRTTFGGSDVASLRFTTIHYITLHYTTLHYTTLHNTTTITTQLHSTTLRYTPRQQITLHYTTLHYTTLHCATFHYTSLHCTTLHSTTLQLQLHNYTPLYSATLHYTKVHYTTLHYTTLHYTTLHNTTTTTTQLQSTTLNYTTLHNTPLLLYNTLHYLPLHFTTLHYTTLHYTTTTTTTTTTELHSTTLHYTTLHYTPLHYITLHSTTLHYTSLHYTTLHSTTLQLHLGLHNYSPLHSTTQNYTTLHYITLHYITLHYTTFHYTPLHYTTLQYTTSHWMTLHHR